MPITFNWNTKIIGITSPTSEVTMQQLHNACRDEEAWLMNLSDSHIVDSFGKVTLGAGVITAITSILKNAWRLQWFNGVGTAQTKDGNLVGTDYTPPIAPTGGNDTIIINNSVGGTIAEDAVGLEDPVTEPTDIDTMPRSVENMMYALFKRFFMWHEQDKTASKLKVKNEDNSNFTEQATTETASVQKIDKATTP